MNVVQICFRKIGPPFLFFKISKIMSPQTSPKTPKLIWFLGVENTEGIYRNFFKKSDHRGLQISTTMRILGPNKIWKKVKKIYFWNTSPRTPLQIFLIPPNPPQNLSKLGLQPTDDQLNRWNRSTDMYLSRIKGGFGGGRIFFWKKNLVVIVK